MNSLPSFRRVLALALLCVPLALHAADKPRPLMRDFMGLCVHTVTFKPELYQPIASRVRDYHPFDWDVGQETDHPTTFPMARNKVDWKQVYGSWKKAGYRTEASIQFDNFDAKKWADLPRDARAYGQAFASYFGPSHENLVEAIEIGNEPGKYDDATYRALFEAMAAGVRLGDPHLRIATCAANLGKSGRYSKSVDLMQGLEPFYDIVNIHVYPEVQGWPTWARSYPEDPKIEFLRDIGHVLKWRDEHAADKEVWLTEFGYDASTKPAPASGDFAKWVGSTEKQQALWTVRAFLVLAATGLDRAYLFYFNDNDEPHVHGSSGLTRNYEPKPSFHAVAHLQKSLGDYRFLKAQKESVEEGYVYVFEHEKDPNKRIWAAWKPQGGGKKETVSLALLSDGWRAVKAERTPLEPGDPPQPVLNWELNGIAYQAVTADEAPVFVWLEK